MDKEELFIKRIRELANMAYQRDITTFTDFLNLNERNILNSQNFHKLGVTAESFGGYENAERQMVAFHSDALTFTWEYPSGAQGSKIFGRSDTSGLSWSNIKSWC